MYPGSHSGGGRRPREPRPRPGIHPDASPGPHCGQLHGLRRVHRASVRPGLPQAEEAARVCQEGAAWAGGVPLVPPLLAADG